MSAADKSPAFLRRTSPTTPEIKRQRSRREEASPQQVLALELPDAVNQPVATNETARAAQVQAVLAGTIPIRTTPVRATPVTRLWLCIHLQALPLEALCRDNADTNVARAVFEEQGGIRKVLLSNSAAISAGIGPGLSVNAALALLPMLALEQRDVPCEQRTLLRLAAWAEQFTSFVAVVAPTVLLLELAGSVRLFDGLQALRQSISAGLGEQGFSAALAIAPTPLAATWLAKAGHRACIQDTANLTGAVSVLPVSCLGWPRSVYDSLYGMGISCVGDCLRLPRQGFAKRFGASRLLELDRGLGRLPDPRVSYRSPERFSAEYELAEEINDSELILNACETLLQKLERFLLTRQLAVQRLMFSFFHLQHPAMSVSLGCVQPDRAVKHWYDLLRLRFEQLTLRAPVIAIRLRAGQGQAASIGTGVLQFSKKDIERQSLSVGHLIERLGARIGSESVHGVTTVAEHRPQYAWRPGLSLDGLLECEAITGSGSINRPLWMLACPEPLAVCGDKPVYKGVLTLQDGPERLETGWWDNDGIARDYFVAVNAKGVRLWVYQNRSKDNGWYLHGIFG